jgi:hypothetical protein
VFFYATQWVANGDHPDDYANARLYSIKGRAPELKPGEFFRGKAEGEVVRQFRYPPGTTNGPGSCAYCGKPMHDHGWIETLEGGHIVCPGDWIITGVKGEHYPCKPDIFAATYEAVEE